MIHELMELGDVILGPLKSRIMVRYLSAVVGIVAMATVIPLDGESQLAGVESLEWWDVPMLLMMAVLVPLFRFGALIGKEELRFLGALDDINRFFYRNHVEPAMARFCAVTDRMKTLRWERQREARSDESNDGSPDGK